MGIQVEWQDTVFVHMYNRPGPGFTIILNFKDIFSISHYLYKIYYTCYEYISDSNVNRIRYKL